MKNKNQIFILAGVVAVLLLVAGAITYSLIGGQNTQGNVPTTVAQTALTTYNCLASIDPETGEQTDPACSALESEEGSDISVIGETHKLGSESTCPLPAAEQSSTDSSRMISHKGKCILNRDVVLDKTIELGSFTTLDCKGHKISPMVPSNPLVPTTGDANASNPEVGIVLNSAFGAKIQNCVIDGFDFGIYPVSSKIPSEAQDDPAAQSLLGIKIMNNTVNAKSSAIKLNGVDNAQVKDNQVNILSTGGVGIMLSGGSNKNLVSGNTVTRLVSGTPIGVRRNPGRFSNTPANPYGIILMIRRVNGTRIGIIGGKVVESSTYTPGLYNNNNVVENNTVDMNRGTQSSGSLSGIAQDENGQGNTIRGNTVKNAVVGVQQDMGGPATETLAGRLPGTCSGGVGTPGPAGRACSTSVECFIPELGDTSAGTCSGTTSAGDDPRPRDTVIENNVVSNSVDGISAQTALGSLTIRGNTVTGAAATHGINLGRSALNSGTLVTRNILSSNGNGLFLTNPVQANGPSAISFGAKVTLNDITGSSLRAIGKTGSTPTTGYTLSPTELSSLLKGNYWGRTCAADPDPNSKGFREFGLTGADSPAAFILDSHPYGVSVATTPDVLLPASCLP